MQLNDILPKVFDKYNGPSEKCPWGTFYCKTEEVIFLSEFIAGIDNTPRMRDADHPMLFRGQSNAGWTLIPKYVRLWLPFLSDTNQLPKIKKEALEQELDSIYYFQERAFQHLPEARHLSKKLDYYTVGEWISIMQHYKTPTRFLADIINYSMRLEDDNLYYLWIVSKNINIFYQFIYRIQMEIQKTDFSHECLARYWKLFYDNDFTPRLFDKFENKYGISIKKWFLCSLCTFAVANKSGVISKIIQVPEFINLDVSDIKTYLSYSTYSAKYIKERYLNLREKDPAEFHFLIRSAFTERPILELNNNLVAPIPELIYRHIGNGLNAMFEEIDKDGYYFGKSFERYTESILKYLKRTTKLYNNKNLETKSTAKKSCDFFLVTPTENILIECKAVDFKVNILTKNAISNSGAASKIIDAIEQMSVTFKAINCDELKLEYIDKKKPFLEIIVTFGDLPGFGSDWIFDEVLPSNSNKSVLKNYLQDRKPLILSIECLTRLISYLNSTDKSLIDLYNHKTQKGYFMTGDWDAFLREQMSSMDKIEPLEFVDDAVNCIYTHLGIGELIK